MSDSEENKKSRLKRVLWWPIKYPLTFVCVMALLYFGFQAYVLDSNPAMNKLVMLAIISAWVILFVLKHLLVLIFLVVALCGILYAYYQYTNRPRIECEEKGGIWVEDTQTCEEKKGIMAEIQKMINKYKKYVKFIAE